MVMCAGVSYDFSGGHGVVLFSRRGAGRGRRGHREPGTVVSADTVGCRDKAQVVGVATTNEDACGLGCPGLSIPTHLWVCLGSV